MNWPMQLEGGCLPMTAAVRTRIYPQTQTHRNRRPLARRTAAATRGNLNRRARQLRSVEGDAVGLGAT
jgi:hypothetical protein